MISIGSMVTGGMLLQSHLLSTTTIKRLLLGICCMTNDLQPKRRVPMLQSEPQRSTKTRGPWPESIPDTVVALNVARRFFDGAFRDESRVLCVTRYHHGFTPRSLS